MIYKHRSQNQEIYSRRKLQDRSKQQGLISELRACTAGFTHPGRGTSNLTKRSNCHIFRSQILVILKEATPMEIFHRTLPYKGLNSAIFETGRFQP